MKQHNESRKFPSKDISDMLKNNIGIRNRYRNDISSLKKQFTKNLIEIKKFLEIMKNKENNDIDIDTLFNSKNLLLTLSNENHLFCIRILKVVNEKESIKKYKTEMKQQKRKLKNVLSYKQSFNSSQLKKSALYTSFKEYFYEYVKGEHSTECTIQLNINSDSFCKISSPIKEVIEENEIAYKNNSIYSNIFSKGNSQNSSYYEKIIQSYEIDKINKIPDINKFDGKIEPSKEETLNCETDKINCMFDNLFIINKEQIILNDESKIKTVRHNENIYKDNILKNLDSIVIKKYDIQNDLPLNPKLFDVLCINCYECVKLEECDNHSLNCIIKPFTDYEEVNNIDKNINNKVYKLHKGLKNLGEIVNTTTCDEMNNLYNTLLKITVEVYQNNNSLEFLNETTLSLTRTIDYLYKKSSIFNSISYYIPLTLYAQRITQLVYQKLDLINKGNFNSLGANNNDSLFKEEDLTERSTVNVVQKISHRNSITKNKKDQINCEKTSLNKIQEITSNIFSNKEVFSNDPSSSNTSVIDLKSNIDINTEHFNSFKKEDELKKYFYSIGLYLKLKYSDNIKENITIQELYKRAISNNVDVNDWNNFLRVQLNIK